MSNTCDIDIAVLDQFKNLRFRKSKSNAALVLKIDAKALMVVEDIVLDDITMEDLASELPETSPRYVILSYENRHGDGRTSYPLIGVFYCPEASSDQSRMLYASAKSYVFQKADIGGKVYDLSDSEDLNDAWVTGQLKGASIRP
ncbi:hypothetical protein SeMB42_g00858 [Synchytrium endobioticum]|uniref:ADF-H domain-containing protein n=1 Tax=Synchytrium endobioticum TaxID=286115 RepID=A0A507DNN8_9FUNG|nr:hypothetical protein SeMB42_g00858 [Synchytrium endobioticum]